MKDVIKGLLASKKFLAAIAGAGVVVLNKALSIDMPEEDLLKILGMIATYILGQSVADFGKEKAKVEHPAKALLAIKGRGQTIIERAPDQGLVDVISANRDQIKKILAD